MPRHKAKIGVNLKYRRGDMNLKILWRFIRLAICTTIIGFSSLILSACIKTEEPLITSDKADFPLESHTHLQEFEFDKISNKLVIKSDASFSKVDDHYQLDSRGDNNSYDVLLKHINIGNDNGDWYLSQTYIEQGAIHGYFYSILIVSKSGLFFKKISAIREIPITTDNCEKYGMEKQVNNSLGDTCIPPNLDSLLNLVTNMNYDNLIEDKSVGTFYKVIND